MDHGHGTGQQTLERKDGVRNFGEGIILGSKKENLRGYDHDDDDGCSCSSCLDLFDPLICTVIRQARKRSYSTTSLLERAIGRVCSTQHMVSTTATLSGHRGMMRRDAGDHPGLQ